MIRSSCNGVLLAEVFALGEVFANSFATYTILRYHVKCRTDEKEKIVQKPPVNSTESSETICRHPQGGVVPVEWNSLRSREKEYRRSVRGFSIVELLVVLGIIMILISLVMPMLGETKAEANRRVCQSEMRQLGLMIAMYASDNKERFPFPLESRGPYLFGAPGGRTVGAAGAGAMTGYWPMAMLDDFGGTIYADVLLCPEDKSTLGARARTAAEMGVDESEVQLPTIRVMSSSMLLDPGALRTDINDWQDYYFHVNSIHDAQFASQKAMLVEQEPLHEPGYVHITDEAGDYITSLPDPNRIRQMITAVDGSADWRSTEDAYPGVEVPGLWWAFLREGGMSDSEIAFQLEHMQRPSYYNFTRNGIRGFDW